MRGFVRPQPGIRLMPTCSLWGYSRKLGVPLQCALRSRLRRMLNRLNLHLLLLLPPTSR